MRLRAILAVPATALLLVMGLAEPSNATVTPPPTDSSVAYQSTLADGALNVAALTTTSTSSGAIIHCNHFYRFTDGDGSFTLQRACGGTTAPWGYTISICAIVVGPLNETGMRWNRNGVAQPTQAPHYGYPCTYQFHGTFNPARGNDNVYYGDTYNFKTSNGSGTLNMSGHVTFVDNPCSPTSC